MNYVSNWNLLDSIIFFCENKLHQVREAVRDSKEAEPDVELMIQAETEYLRTENENLKKREIPVYMIEEDGTCFCPKCRNKLSPQVRYCANCGHRVMCFDERRIESAN